MRTLVRLLIAATAVVAAVTVPGLPALADGGGGAGGTATAYVDESGDPTAEARDANDTPARASRSASNCQWVVVIQDDNTQGIYEDDGTRLHSETGRWLGKICDGQQVIVNGAFAIPEPRTDPAALALEARESVPIPGPPINTSPEADRELYTRVRTWLWLDSNWWHAYTATANAGGVSTTVSATPTRATWVMGDGGSVVCEGPGVVWREGMSDDETYCSYVYKNASSTQESGTYTITVTVEFAVTWTSNVGSGGALGGITRSASRTVRVGEIQAIETQ